MPKGLTQIRGKDWSATVDFTDYFKFLGELNLFTIKLKPVLMEKASQVVVKQIKKNILKGGNPTHPLHPVTIALKGTGTPLIEKGRMLRGVGYRVKGNVSDIGWHSDPGAAAAAAVADEGATIRVSDSMRKLFAASGFPLRASTTTLSVKPRPITTDVLEEVTDSGKLEKAFLDAARETSETIGGRQFF